MPKRKNQKPLKKIGEGEFAEVFQKNDLEAVKKFREEYQADYAPELRNATKIKKKIEKGKLPKKRFTTPISASEEKKEITYPMYEKSLDKVLKEGDPIAGASGIRQSLKAIKALHNQKMVHKDYNPKNVLVKKNNAALHDWGSLSKMESKNQSYKEIRDFTDSLFDYAYGEYTGEHMPWLKSKIGHLKREDKNYSHKKWDKTHVNSLYNAFGVK